MICSGIENKTHYYLLYKYYPNNSLITCCIFCIAAFNSRENVSRPFIKLVFAFVIKKNKILCISELFGGVRGFKFLKKGS